MMTMMMTMMMIMQGSGQVPKCAKTKRHNKLFFLGLETVD